MLTTYVVYIYRFGEVLVHGGNMWGIRCMKQNS